jgi:Fe-S cluster assembly protein SufD
MTVTVLKTPAEQQLQDAYAAFSSTLSPSEVARRAPFARQLVDQGLPNRRVEAFKYTDLRAKLTNFSPLADAMSLGDARTLQSAFATVPRSRFLFAHGVALETAQIAGVSLRDVPLEEALSGEGSFEKTIQNSALMQLHGSFVQRVFEIRVAAGVHIDTPLHLAFVAGDEGASYTEVRLVLEAGARAHVLESYETSRQSVHRMHTMVRYQLADEAHVEVCRLQAEGPRHVHLSQSFVELGARSRFARRHLSAGAALSRHEISLHFAGENAEASLHAVQLLAGQRHGDVTLYVHHDAVGCVAREQQKTVLCDEAHGVFQGKILVSAHAQKTDGQMSSQTLMLSDKAEMSAKPELEIYADDVQCGHGATCGALDPEQLFYLQARGLPTAEAEAVLVEAFILEAFDKLEDESLYDVFAHAVRQWLLGRF